MPLFLLAAFFITALLYASVGFGGGSTYTALLAVSGTSYLVIPLISLSCNILVVTGNVVRYARQRLYDWHTIWPLLILSVPAAWVGGRLVISESVFVGLLWIALLLAGLRMLFPERERKTAQQQRTVSPVVNAFLGGAIGFFSGMVGIGGGIFLAPILHLMCWGPPRRIAALCSLFILVNSISGMFGQIAKLSDLDIISDAIAYWPLLPAVIIGGTVGNYLGVFKISEKWLKRFTGLLIVIVAIRLCIKWVSLIS